MADDSFNIEYNQDFEPLADLLETVNRSGDFFVSGSVEIPMPRVEVEGVGTLSFPVPEPQVRQLIGKATRAPYGRGKKTILDESVRKVWQLPPDKVRIGGKSWTASFAGILKQVTAGLGCEEMTVTAELYKLLVYDQGGFFLAHRDTEKAGGMFGTLVVVLPSGHQGGELVIRHGQREVTIDLVGSEVSEVTFAAFYADCEHEVKAVTEGNRVCLVFNLILQRDARRKNEPLHAPEFGQQIAAAAQLLEQNLAGAGAPAKIAWLLEHHYSPDGLSFDGLKSVDAARVKVLAQAAERAGCMAHLGIVHIEESGSANAIYEDYRPRGWKHYRHHDEEEEVEDAGDEDFEVIEVCNWRHYVAQWRDLRNQPADFGEIPLEPGELLPAGALDDEKPDEQRVMEASGNEGASFERSYHRAALVLWRRECYAEVLLQAGVGAAVPYLAEKVETCSRRNAPPAAREEAIALARKMAGAWKETSNSFSYQPSAAPQKRDRMLTLLAQLGDGALLAKFVSNVVTRDYDGSDNAALAGCVPVLGQNIGTLYAEVVRQHMPRRHKHCVDLLQSLAKLNKATIKTDALAQVADAIVSKIEEVGGEERPNEWNYWRTFEKPPPVDAALIANSLNTLHSLDARILRVSASEKFAARPAVFDPVTIVVPALASVRAWDAAIAHLWEHSAAFLLRRSGSPPEAPKDWRQGVSLSCSCADCCELQKFSLDPQAQVGRFRVRQDRRQHLHQMIENHNLDMTHVTERKGSPQTLVCTKDRRSYNRRCDEYRGDLSALLSLWELGKQHGASARVLGEIETARALSAGWRPA